jgi:hypothetical protein
MILVVHHELLQASLVSSNIQILEALPFLPCQLVLSAAEALHPMSLWPGQHPQAWAVQPQQRLVGWRAASLVGLMHSAQLQSQPAGTQEQAKVV